MNFSAQPLPPAPDDLWTELPEAVWRRDSEGRLSIDIPREAEQPFLTELCRGTILGMGAAGQTAAQAQALRKTHPVDSGLRLGRSREQALRASHLLRVYEAVYGSTPRTHLPLPDVEELRFIATRAYQSGFRLEQTYGTPPTDFNDALFADLSGRSPSRRKPHH